MLSEKIYITGGRTLWLQAIMEYTQWNLREGEHHKPSYIAYEYILQVSKTNFSHWDKTFNVPLSKLPNVGFPCLRIPTPTMNRIRVRPQYNLRYHWQRRNGLVPTS